MVTMKSIKYQFRILIFACLFLMGYGDRADDGVAKMDSDYLLEKDGIGNGVFVSEHLSETEEFIGQLLIETVENKGSVSEEKKQELDELYESLKKLTIEQFAEINMEYVPELSFCNHYKIKEGIFICWNDMIILDEAVYRIEDGTYKKTDENLCDFFNLTELTECGAYGVKQYYNLIITVDNSLERFLIYDMESMETYSYEVYDAGSLAGYDWYVCNGNIYYEVQEDINELNRMIICMDILTGENKKIYSLSEDELSQNMTLAYSFMLRADESMLVAVYNGNAEAVNYKKITIDSNRPTEEQLWKTDKYMYLYSLQYNEAGAFILGEFYRTEGGKETEVICLKDNGDIALSNILSVYGLLMTDEGYYLCDNSREPYMMADMKTDDWIAVIDSITFFNYEGEMVKRYYLDSEELRQKGYKLENIIYAGEKIMVFYCNETTGDLQIKYLSLSE